MRTTLVLVMVVLGGWQFGVKTACGPVGDAAAGALRAVSGALAVPGK